MYQIAVCEDEPHLRAGLYARCQNILGKLETEHETVPFSSAEKLGSISADGTRFDLLFLDIFLVEQNGMELAHKVRKWNEQVSILFIASSTEFLLEGYGVRPTQYLLKPGKRERVKKAILTDLRLNHQPRTVTLGVRGKTAVLSLADIWYIKSQNHGRTFHMSGGDQAFALDLAQMEQLLLRNQFCRCHNIYLVNLAHIKEFAGREIVLTDGARRPVVRLYVGQFQSELIRCINNR